MYLRSIVILIACARSRPARDLYDPNISIKNVVRVFDIRNYCICVFYMGVSTNGGFPKMDGL